jgi:hypothetical protein
MQIATNNIPDIEEAIVFVNIQRKASKLAFYHLQ